MKVSKKMRAVLKGEALLFTAPLFALVLLFQNCAPAPLHSRELSSTNGVTTGDAPMSKIVVHLTNDSSVTLSDVELVADDVNDTIDQVSNADATSVGKITSSVNVTEAATGTGYNLELPTGLQKIIVARAKFRDPISNKIATYYGNAVVIVSDSLGDVSIQMVALP